jgi:hypothetical protein
VSETADVSRAEEGRRWWTLPPAWRERADWAPPDTTLGRVLRGARWAAVLAYAAFLIEDWHAHGLPFARDRLLLTIVIGLGCLSIGRHPAWLAWAIVDFLPFGLVLLAYDALRGLADGVGMPAWWYSQLELDKFLFLGHEPTVWLQEHLKHSSSGVRSYDLVTTLTYASFFFVPYVAAGVFWLRRRADFYRWSLRFVSLSFLSFVLFVLIPAAPPWAAALCTAEDVKGHPSDPSCLHHGAHAVAGNLLGPYTSHLAGAHPYVERIAGESFYKLHLAVAHQLWTKGFSAVDAVAAVPSLHVGGTVLFSLFMWSRLRAAWRPLLVLYPLVMQFSLTYAGEHYVVDGIAGAFCACLIHWVATRVEDRHRSRRLLLDSDPLGRRVPLS